MKMKMVMEYPLVERVRGERVFRTPRNVLLKVVIFVLVFAVASVAETVFMLIFIMPRLMEWAMEEIERTGGALDNAAAMEKIYAMLEEPENMAIMLFSTVMGTVTVLIFCRWVEGRKLSTLGFRKKGAVKSYLWGLVAGFLMFSAIVGFALMTGGVRYEGRVEFSLTSLGVMLAGYLLQGMSEEVLCRGYLMTTIVRDRPVWEAVVINALAFGLLHCQNQGFSPVALVNLSLFGVMISLYVLRTDNLWGACAIHSIWNFVQGNFYGLPVSGTNPGDSVFRMSLGKNAWLSGGDFGLEASVGATIVLLAVIAVLLFLPKRKKSDEGNDNEEENIQSVSSQEMA